MMIKTVKTSEADTIAMMLVPSGKQDIGLAKCGKKARRFRMFLMLQNGQD